MATHSSILAWRTPRTEEPGGLQSMGVAKESDTTEATWHALCTSGYLEDVSTFVLNEGINRDKTRVRIKKAKLWSARGASREKDT